MRPGCRPAGPARQEQNQLGNGERAGKAREPHARGNRRNVAGHSSRKTGVPEDCRAAPPKPERSHHSGSPDELPDLKPLQIQRHADPIVPRHLDRVAFTAPEAEDLTIMRVAPQPLPVRQRQPVHSAARGALHVATARAPGRRLCQQVSPGRAGETRIRIPPRGSGGNALHGSVRSCCGTVQSSARNRATASVSRATVSGSPGHR